MLWVPYIVSETVIAETNNFTCAGKTFAMAAINDQKVSVEEAVQVFESLQSLQRIPAKLKRRNSAAC